MTWTSWDVGSIHQSFSTIQGIWISVLVIFSHVAQSHMTSQEVLFPFFFRFNLQIPSWDVRQRFLHLFHLKAWVWLAAVQILVRSLGEKVCAVVLAAPGLISWVGWSTTPGFSYLRNQTELKTNAPVRSPGHLSHFQCHNKQKKQVSANSKQKTNKCSKSRKPEPLLTVMLVPVTIPFTETTGASLTAVAVTLKKFLPWFWW